MLNYPSVPHTKICEITTKADHVYWQKGTSEALLEQLVHYTRDRRIINFSVKRLWLEAGIDKRISDCTVGRCLNELGYKYLQSRRKGLMSRKDIKIRLRYARKVKRLLPNDFWTNGISFYILDGTSFTHKRNHATKRKAGDQWCGGKSVKVWN